MTTPEPPGEPTPPSFEKPAAGGSPYDTPPPTGGGSPYDAVPPYQAVPPHGQTPPSGEPPLYNPGPYGEAPPNAMPPLGGPGRRLVARIIDWVLLGILAIPVRLIAYSAYNHDHNVAGSLFASIVVLLGLLYEGLMLTLVNGQTVGKMVMHIRVAVLADGSSPTGATGWIRAAVWEVPALLCCGFWWIIDGLWCTWDRPYQQALHDKAAKTVVVKVA